MFTGVGRLTRDGHVEADLAGGGHHAGRRFQLASVSKQFTAAAVLLLVDAGKLNLDDSIGRWIDRSPDSWRDITIHHLLTHTAGLPHWHDVPEVSLTEPMGAEDEIGAFVEHGLRSAPGTEWYYSSPGYFLLAQIVQEASGAAYRDYLEEKIFRPLALDATFAGNAGAHGDVATGHVGGEAVKSFELDTTGMGAGDVWSTVGDVLRWDEALASPGFLSDQALRSMTLRHATLPTPDHLEEGSRIEADGYGYAWYLGRFGEHRVVAHPGDNAGFRALNLLLPDDNVKLVMLVDDEQSELASTAQELIQQVLR